MAVVLTSEESGYFSPGTLRRSHSQSQFTNPSSTYSSSASKIDDDYNPLSKPYSRSAPSSTSSSPRIARTESTDPSSASTPASNFSLASDYDDGTLAFDEPHEPVQDGFGLASYKQDGRLTQTPTSSPDDNLEPPPSPKTGDSYTPPPDYDSSNDTPKPDTPEFLDHAEDDTAVATRPSRQVDYLSHEWREEDIWSSWRYIVNRRGEFPNSARLENASWRTWMKSKNNLKTVSPETLNWLKECDVTWLYGPLQPGQRLIKTPKSDNSSGSLSKTDSLVNLKKKPILKKRSMSEVMLQRSLSTASLLKQATAAVQAQETKGILRPSLVRSSTDSLRYPFPSRRVSQGDSSVAVSEESSSITSPSSERKHIHFNEQVEQCIAVDVKGEDDDEVDMEPFGDDSDSDGGVVMKRTRSRKSSHLLKKRKKKAQCSEGKTIAMLPSTTLKYREDTPEPQETAMKHSTGRRSPLISPSSSQETLRPSTSRARFFFGEEEDDVADGFCDPDTNWRPPPSELDGHANLHRSTSSGSLADEPAGMRRTPSGMFMPYEEGGTSGEGIFGRVIDTVNTARDIAHVIWNVGWRK